MKTEQRRYIEQKRSQLSDRERMQQSMAVVMKLCKDVVEPMAEAKASRLLTIFTYVPVRAEVDVSSMFHYCWIHGHRVCVPKVVPETKQMELRIIRGPDELEEGWRGLREPKKSCPMVTDLSEIDLIVIPGVAFDRRGGRLGYGGGYYDRFIRQFEANGLTQPTIIAPAYNEQIVDEVPTEPHDVRVDLIISEKEIIRI